MVEYSRSGQSGVAPSGDPADWTATRLVSAYERRELSPVEATRAVIERIERDDGAVNAYCLLDPDGALASAEQSETRWQAGEPLSRLDGVPASIKDLILTRGWPTLRGSRTVDPDQVWDVDAPSVARLREAGAVLVGKTTTPELGWKGTCDSPLTGITRNPWDTARTTGGSSGGAAAAVVCGMAPLAVGTDGGGSVRIPGSFSGAVGFKPTYGRVPHYPPSPFGTLAHAGPLTRVVEDAALMLDVITGFDSRDWSALAQPSGSFVRQLTPDADLDRPLLGVRVAYSRTLGYVHVDPEVSGLVDAAVRVLADLGAVVEEEDPGFDDCVEGFECLWFSGAAKATEHIDADGRKRMDPGLAAAIEQGLGYDAQDYLDGTATRMAMGVRMGAFHERHDLLVTPTMPMVAFDAERQVPPGRPGARWTAWTPFTYPFNMTQQPALSVPCGFTDAGLPVGLQIVGPRHADARVLAAGKAYQDATSWWLRRPTVSSPHR